MVTLENKCTLISMFDALAFQYPQILQTHDLNTPLDFVQFMLEGEASGWGLNNKTKNGLFTYNIKKSFVTNQSGHPAIYPFICWALDINMCVDEIPNLSNTKDYLANICPATRPKVLNICSEGKNHVEFHPFPYVRTKKDQELYEMYSSNSREQIKKFEMDKFAREESKAFNDLMTIAAEDLLGVGDGVEDLYELVCVEN